MLGLLPTDIEVAPRPRASRVPETVRQEIARLKALDNDLQYREIVRIIFYKCGYRLHPKTAKRLWQQSQSAIQEELALGDYHSQGDRYQARVQVIKLYYQGWTKRSISRVFHVSRPTIDRWIQRFEAEHFAGLVDRSFASGVCSATRIFPCAPWGASWPSTGRSMMISPIDRPRTPPKTRGRIRTERLLPMNFGLLTGAKWTLPSRASNGGASSSWMATHGPCWPGRWPPRKPVGWP